MIDVAALARTAEGLRVPVTQRYDGPDGEQVVFEVTAEMAVTVLTPGWEAVWNSDGPEVGITGFRPVPVDPFTRQDNDVIAIIEMLRKFARNGAGLAEAAALTVAFLRDGQSNPQQEGS